MKGFDVRAAVRLQDVVEEGERVGTRGKADLSRADIVLLGASPTGGTRWGKGAGDYGGGCKNRMIA